MAEIVLFHHAQGLTDGMMAIADEFRATGHIVHTPDLYGGFSLGALPAQRLAQTRPRARAALLYHGGVPTSTFGTSWPVGVPLQIHLMEDDEWSELDVAEGLRDEIADAELFVYPGSSHLFADSSLPDHDPDAARLLIQRSLELLSRLD